VENAISGEILLEMGVEDLDYMKITALGHRKVRVVGKVVCSNAILPFSCSGCVPGAVEGH
jgi:hypothetical protein